jgi:DNA-binding NtrC family response regulator
VASPEKNDFGLPDPQDRKPAILIVEDEVLIRLALSDYLQECGFKVFETADAAEAVEILESNQADIDLVFTDVFLTGEMSGFALAQWTRTNRPELSVVLASGDTRLAKVAKELCENEPFLTKPYDFAAVVTQLRDFIDAKKGRP